MGLFTRRDVLTALLGAPLASAACKRPRRVPDGEIAFRPDELGHAIRGGRPPEIGDDKRRDVGVVIVGGGVAGLSAAYRLSEAGYDDFVLLELDGAAGGTARSGANGVSGYPWGAHYITAPMKDNAPLLSLLDRFGVLEGRDEHGEPIFREELLCREPQERVFEDGAWHDGLYAHHLDGDDERAQFESFREAMEAFAELRDARGRRAFAVPTSSGSTDALPTRELDRLSMDAWMTSKGFSSPRLKWLVDYACRDDFGARATQTSAWAGVHYYASRLVGRGSDPQPVLTWPEGNGWLVRRLYERVRANVRFGLAVLDVAPSGDGEEARATVTAVGKPPIAASFRARRVIFAAPQMVARHVLRPYRDAPPPHLSRFTYGAWMVANITLSGRPKRARGDRGMAWDNVISASPSLGYVVATHQTGRDHGPTVLTYYYPLCDDDPREARKKLLSASRDEWADVALSDLEVPHPDIRTLATRVDVVRWGHAIVRPSPGFFTSSAQEDAQRPFRGVHFAHTDLSGIALFEEAFAHGQRAADEVLDALGFASRARP